MVQKFDFWYPAAHDNRRIHLYLPVDYEQSNERKEPIAANRSHYLRERPHFDCKNRVFC